MKTLVLPRVLSFARRPAGFAFVAALICLAACVQPQTPSNAQPPVTPSSYGCPAGETAKMAWPQLTDLQPRPVVAGSAVTVTASGGYVTCGASGVNESSRYFQIDLDSQPVGSISCYVNHCEGNFVLPATTAAGAHVVTADGGSRLTFVVTAR